MTRTRTKPAQTTIRCAIYTRKSTEEGLDQEFNTLDSQREYAESYIKSQSEEGWIWLPDRYDDGGFSGGRKAFGGAASPLPKAGSIICSRIPPMPGKICYKTEVHEGEQETIVDPETFRKVQNLLAENAVAGSADKRNKHGALLRGLLRCAACHCGMTHTFTVKGFRRYRYYLCNHAQQHGRATCPAPSLPAGEIERFVVEEVKAIGRDPTLVAATWAESRRLAGEAIQGLKHQRAALERQRRADEAELRKLTAAPAKNGELARLVEVQERRGKTERRLAEVEAELAWWMDQDVGEDEVAAALAEFDAVWAVLAPQEQVRVLELLIERIDYDGQAGNIAITFHPTGIKTLAERAAVHEETAA